MSTPAKRLLGAGALAVLLVAALALAHDGNYGWTLFVMLPLIAGCLAACLRRPRTVGQAAGLGAIVGFAGCALFLLLGAEGIICVVMACPIVVPLSIIGSLLAYWGGAWPRRSGPAVMSLLLPVTMMFDGTAKPPVFSVTTSIVVNAAPERVWKYVVAFPDISAEPDWVLRTGLAYPVRTRIEGRGVGAPRNCDLSTGTVQERVETWDEPRLLRFAVIATPPAMEEMGLYGPIHPKHLEGYYISKKGEFSLTPLAGGRTLVAGTSWYQHGLWPANYWRWWSNIVVHHIHRRVLNHIRTLAESD